MGPPSTSLLTLLDAGPPIGSVAALTRPVYTSSPKSSSSLVLRDIGMIW